MTRVLKRRNWKREMKRNKMRRVMMMTKREILTPRHNQSFSLHAFLERTASTCRMQTAVTMMIRGGGDLLPIKSVLSLSIRPPTAAGSTLLQTHRKAIEPKPMFLLCA